MKRAKKGKTETVEGGMDFGTYLAFSVTISYCYFNVDMA
jgi:hypothetical protein